MSVKKIFAACCSCVILFACTKSPVNSDIENPTALQIRGRVELADGASPEGIYVWLGDTPLATSTDRSGAFQVTLPPAAPGSAVYASGIFDLFFYVANYKLASTPVVVQAGKFLYARGQIDRNGELIGTLSMQKLLNIATSLDPPVVTANYVDPINVTVTLSAVFDTVVVVFPKILGGELAALLFRNMDTGKIVAEQPEVGRTPVSEKISKTPSHFHFSFSLQNGFLPAGRYEVIPYFLIEQEAMPAGLLANISPRAAEIGPEFLKIPFRRAGGQFTVRGDPQ